MKTGGQRLWQLAGWTAFVVTAVLLAGPADAQSGWLSKVPFIQGDASATAASDAKASAPKGGLRGGQEGKTALVRVLDKQTNRLQTLAGAVGSQLPGVPMKVVVGRCVKSIGGVPGQDAAWLTLGLLQGQETWFDGWMFNTYPDVATLDQPRYDVQLVACDKSAEDKIAPVLPIIKVEESVGSDDEAPADAKKPAADNGSDPYYVPGVGAGTVVAPADAEAEMPAARTEEPAEPAAPKTPDEAAPEQGDSALHELMDGGQN